MANSSDLTRPPDLLHERRTGPFVTQRPIYRNLLPPCNDACPAGENIQAWLDAAQAGRCEEAWRILSRDNPMPAVHGRVCYHPCESACNRKHLDDAVSIHAVERFLGDLALEKGWTFEAGTPSGKRVLIVGAGPSGLSAAYHLARLGHEVEIHEAGPVAGGMMHFGIPAYRLPRDILEAETARIEAMGVKMVFEHKVEDLLAEQAAGNFDAMFVAVGAHLSRRTNIPARDAGTIFDAVSYLRDVDEGAAPQLGRRVAVYGGGNTAMDAARTAKRLGATEALIIYRRDQEHMPAHAFEAQDAQEEGVKIHWLRTIKAIDQTRFTVEKMEIDENGRPKPTGEMETLEADSLILALGQESDTAFMRGIPDVEFQDDGTVLVSDNMMTRYPGLFAGGDMVPAERTVTAAVGHGKKAARHIDAWLRGETYRAPAKNPIAGYEKLHVWYSTDAPQKPQEHLDADSRTESFEEIIKGLTEAEATYEARRCLSCGNCYECDGCYGACPEQAIAKLGRGKGYRVKEDLCTGCAVCYEQCPCHAIEMVPEAVSGQPRAS